MTGSRAALGMSAAAVLVVLWARHAPSRLPAAAVTAEAAPAHKEQPLTADRFGDGTPDFLRLDEDRDRRAFRRWFTFLAETQYFQAPEARPAEIKDCAALIRYAYRETLRAHETGWAEAARVPLVPPFDAPAKYHYPRTPLGSALFRVREGPLEAEDFAGGAFAQFADAQTLRRYNTYFVGRDLAKAQAGDLLFYHHEDAYHSMIYLGASQMRPDGKRYVVYHTGPDGNDPGEMKRLSESELAHFPEMEWRPMAVNPNFLGVYRWNILREAP